MNQPKDRFTVFMLTLSALAISASAAFFSVYGLSKLFAGASLAVIIMASILEASKLIVAYSLHKNSKKLPATLRAYLTIAVAVLMIITSAGIYGFLSNAYQITANANTVVEKEVAIIQAKVDNNTNRLNDLLSEKESLVKDINGLRQGITAGTTIETVDRRTGLRLVARDNNIAKSINAQLLDATERRNRLDGDIEMLSATVDSFKIQILEKQSNNTAAAELGPLIYLSKLTSIPMDRLINYFILMIVFVFDPLAVSLVLALSRISDYDKGLVLDTEPLDVEEEYLEPEDQDTEIEESIEEEQEHPLYNVNVAEGDTNPEHVQKVPKFKVRTVKKRVPEYKVVDNGQRVVESKEVEEFVLEPSDDEDGATIPLSPEEYDKLVEKFLSQYKDQK